MKVKLNLPPFRTLPNSQRSALTSLTKIELVEMLVDQIPSRSYPRIAALLTKRQGKLFKARQEISASRRVEFVDMLMSVPRDELVTLTYTIADERLNARYGAEHKTVADPDRDEIKQDFYALKTDRPIELPRKMLTWKSEFKKRAKRGFKVRFKRSAPKKAAPKKHANDVIAHVPKGKRKVRKTLNWIAALKSHSAYLAHDATKDLKF